MASAWPGTSGDDAVSPFAKKAGQDRHRGGLQSAKGYRLAVRYRFPSWTLPVLIGSYTIFSNMGGRSQKMALKLTGRRHFFKKFINHLFILFAV